MAAPLWGVLAALLLFAQPHESARAQLRQPDEAFAIARLKYGGGGDWYNGPTQIPNLLAFLRAEVGIRTADEEARVEAMDEDLFAYAVLYMTGHGNVRFSEEEVVRLRTYLERGGFLFANDDYGMDKSFRREISRVFPDKKLVGLPRNHGIFNSPFRFTRGLPKIHEHDGKPPQAFGLFHQGRMVLFYNYESDVGDGWDDPDVHGDPPEKRLAALRMGANVITWALTH